MNFKFRIWNGEKYLSLQEALNECIVGFKYNKDNSFELEPYYEDVLFEISTGLTDKNGIEIYEGDLVKDELTRASIVEFRTGAFCIEGVTLDNHLGYLWSNGYNNVEVVGNIHEVTE